MSLIPLGFWAASGGGAGAPAFDLLETQVLTSDTASVTFTGLGSYTDYKHLQLRMVTRYNRASVGTVNAEIVLNSDTGANYSNHYIRGGGTSVASASLLGADHISIRDIVVGNNTTANSFGAAIVDILDFSSSSKNSTTKTLAGSLTANETAISLNSGAYLNTAAITTIQISPGVESWLTGCRFSLYGVK